MSSFLTPKMEKKKTGKNLSPTQEKIPKKTMYLTFVTREAPATQN